MKNLKLKSIIVIALIITIKVNAQTEWSLTGNSIGSTDFIGSTNADNFRIRTNDTPRMIIKGDGTNDGFVGIGTTTPSQMLHVAGNGYFSGNVGINTPAPAYKLDVTGDINISTNQVYRINGKTVLADKSSANPLNIFVGYLAGDGIQAGGGSGYGNACLGTEAGRYLATSSATDAIYNTIVGSKAGVNITEGDYNTVLGHYAGGTLSSATYNCLVGSHCGYNLTTPSNNTFVGAQAGFYNQTGENNVYIGYNSGLRYNGDSYNTFIGYLAAGQDGISPTGTNNVFVGYKAGYTNTSGNSNTYIGNQADGSATLTNATAIGANASVTLSNAMVLGSINGVNGATANTNVGIGTTAPVQRLHVEGTARITGSDGTATTVMGRDADGDVSILGLGTGFSITGGTLNYSGPGSGTITACNSPTPANNYVTKWTNAPTEICNSIIFDTGQEVGISTTTPAAKLDVVNTTENITGRFFSNYGSATSVLNVNADNTVIDPAVTSALGITALYASSVHAAGGLGGMIRGGIIGVYGHAIGGIEDQNTYGVWGYSDNSDDDNYGVWGEAIGDNTQDNPNLMNFGVHGRGTGDSEWNVGLYGYAEGSSTSNYGIYGSYTGTQDQYNCAGYFNGRGYSTIGFYTTSDINLKQNVQDYNQGLSVISQLSPKSFEFRTDEYPQLNLALGTNYGLIAQEVEPIIPSIIANFIEPAKYDEDGNVIHPAVPLKAINYAGIVPFLIAAIQEQQAQIDDLNSRLTSCCGPGIQEFQVPGYTVTPSVVEGQSTINHQQLASVARDLPVLSQNQPNPFTEKTLIRFYIPKTTKDAAIKVFDNTGSVYRLFSITGEGPGTIELEANSLAAGNYYYSLLIGGNVIDTKTMVITK